MAEAASWWLQLSRGVTAAETMEKYRYSPDCTLALQLSRGVTAAETPVDLCVHLAVVRLQLSRGVTAAETSVAPGPRRRPEGSFN